MFVDWTIYIMKRNTGQFESASNSWNYKLTISYILITRISDNLALHICNLYYPVKKTLFTFYIHTCRRKRLLYSRINKNQNSMPMWLVKYFLTTSRSKMDTSPSQHGDIWPMIMNMHMSKGLYRVIPAVTHIVGFCGLIWKTTPFIHLGSCRPILFKILPI